MLSAAWLTSRLPSARVVLSGDGLPSALATERLLGLARRRPLRTEDAEERLRARLARRLLLNEEELLLVPGSRYGLHLATESLARRSEWLVLESPTRPEMHRAAEATGAGLRRFARLIREDFDLPVPAIDELLDDTTAGVLLTDLHVPSCRSLSETRLAELAALLEFHGAWALVDESLREALPAAKRSWPTAARCSPRICAVGGFSKVPGMPDLLISWIAGATEVLRPMRERHEQLLGRISSLDAWAALHALEHWEGIAEAALVPYRENWPFLREWCTTQPGVHAIDPGGGTCAVVRLPEATDSLAIADRLFETRGVLVAPAELFGGRGFLRLALASRRELELGLPLLGEVLASMAPSTPDREAG